MTQRSSLSIKTEEQKQEQKQKEDELKIDDDRLNQMRDAFNPLRLTSDKPLGLKPDIALTLLSLAVAIGEEFKYEAALSDAMDDFKRTVKNIDERYAKSKAMQKPANVYEELLNSSLLYHNNTALVKLSKQRNAKKFKKMDEALSYLRETAKTHPVFSDLLKTYDQHIEAIRNKTRDKCDAVGVPASKMACITLLTCCLIFKAQKPDHPANSPTGVNTLRAKELARQISSYKTSSLFQLAWTARVKKANICETVDAIFNLQTPSNENKIAPIKNPIK